MGTPLYQVVGEMRQWREKAKEDPSNALEDAVDLALSRISILPGTSASAPALPVNSHVAFTVGADPAPFAVGGAAEVTEDAAEGTSKGTSEPAKSPKRSRKPSKTTGQAS